MEREIVLDTETTGLDPRNGDRLVEIGGVELVNRFPTGRTYHVYINPERDVPIEAFNVHGLSAEFLADKPRFDDIADDFRAFIEGAKLVIHNAQFDMGFINMELKQSGRSSVPPEFVIDTLALARRKHPGSPVSLDALCSRYGIDNSRRTKHGALLDSELLAEVYIELLGGRQADLGLTSEAEARVRDRAGLRLAARKRPEPLMPRLTAAEIVAHQEFVATLGEKAMWHQWLDDSETAGEA
ncbi:DNA polymerase III subunit epsilon [Hartmannibacter diazotrophicus]|uniref:DNA polymerase III subunit epsilon n=1 Tax=Hartmannibacter diazotrophicus TaxID=1482074 RepID=A0A2C9DDE7_9HYPH|nr:DNA polymerase III subunit epsilon [Hartmannibacter diazotrophicus]SON58189.1 DNA polymerase III subunit epsilon [Hartmannibacter diazotrophicus]